MVEKTNMNKDSQKEQLIKTFLTREPVFSLDEIDVSKAEQKILRQIETAKPVRRVLIYFQRIAAVLFIPLVLLSVYLATKSNSRTEEVEAWQEISVPHGTFSHIHLSDGTKVWINGGSSLKFPIRFKKERRQVWLNGEGYFEVESDQQNPFLVQTSQMLLTATGTAFNIEAYTSDSLTAVTMIDGKTIVTFDDVSPINLTAGQRMAYNNETGRNSIVIADPYKWYAWKNGLMIFRDDPLSYVFKRLEQTFNVHINIKNPEIGHDLYRATFEDESLDEILRLLEKTAPIRFVYHKRERNSEQIYAKKQIDVYKHINPDRQVAVICPD
jgi:ferric-dicitrate binding protein FerR (iron transport regulator)